jgi:hypothetical protein
MDTLHLYKEKTYRQIDFLQSYKEIETYRQIDMLQSKAYLFQQNVDIRFFFLYIHRLLSLLKICAVIMF